VGGMEAVWRRPGGGLEAVFRRTAAERPEPPDLVS
jgi:hypothetical protein